MSCCPVESYGFLDNSTYTPKGTVEDAQGLPVYIVGKGDKCIIWNYDIYGFDAGMTRQHCDLLAGQGFLVILPDYYRGKWIAATDPGLMAWIKSYPFASLEEDVNKAITFAKSKGAKVFGSVGTCWGSYLVMNLSSLPDFKAGVSIHPSHSKMCMVLDENEKALLEGVACKQLFFPAGNDHENCLPGGLAETVLGGKLTIECFPDMIHGWSTRGDLANPSVKRDIDRAVQLYLQFFKDTL